MKTESNSYKTTRKLGNVRLHIMFRARSSHFWHIFPPNGEQIKKTQKFKDFRKTIGVWTKKLPPTQIIGWGKKCCKRLMSSAIIWKARPDEKENQKKQQTLIRSKNLGPLKKLITKSRKRQIKLNPSEITWI